MSAHPYAEALPARGRQRVYLAASWAIVIASGAALLLLYVRALPYYFTDLLDDPGLRLTAERAGLPYLPEIVALAAIQILGTAVFVGTAALLAWRRPGDRVVVVLALTILGGAVKTGVTFEPLLRANPELSLPIAALSYGTTPLFLLAAYTFPDGRFVPRATLGLWIVFAVWQMSAIAFDQLRWDATTLGRLIYFAFLSTAPLAQLHRYRVKASEQQRQQLKWILLAGSIFVPVAAARGFLPLALPEVLGPDAGMSHLIFKLIANAAYTVAFAALPVLVAVAILKYGLFDVDTLLNRALAYGIAAVLLAVALASLVALGQRLAGATVKEHSELATAALALIAVVAFGPLRSGARRYVDRLLPPRAVVTLLFSDIVGSTRQAAALGDERWRDLLARYRAAVRKELKRCDGREIDTAGDGFFVMFEHPLMAIRCAAAFSAALQPLGLQCRTGIHTGACELRGEKLSGLNVHAAARIMSTAGPGEVLLSEDTRRSAGTVAACLDRGEHSLTGVPGKWHLFALQVEHDSAL